jgi:uncharacterized membrane protein
MAQKIIGVVILLLGVLFLILGKKSKDKFEKNNPPDKHHSGVIFQSNTIFIYLGFVLTLSGITLIIGS